MKEKRIYGWRKNASTEQVTTERIQEYLEEVFYKKIENEDRHIVIGQYCKNKGFITIDSKKLDFPYCNDPTCSCAPSLEMFDKAMKEEVKKFIDGK